MSDDYGIVGVVGVVGVLIVVVFVVGSSSANNFF